MESSVYMRELTNASSQNLKLIQPVDTPKVCLFAENPMFLLPLGHKILSA